MTRISNIAVTLAALAILLILMGMAGPSVEISLKDGSKWRGQVSDAVELRYMQQGVEVPLSGKLVKVESLYVVVEGAVAGATRQVTIFKSDIVSMKTTEAGASDSSAPATQTATTTPVPATRSTSAAAAKPQYDKSQPGVFVLPMVGGVGETIRLEELKMFGEYIDKNYGPGQVLVFLINTNGGSSPETEKMGKIIRDLRTRHRVIAWIEKAISAGCQIAMYCNEIYFMTEGTAGSVTTWNMGTGQAVRGELLDKILEEFARVAEDNGHSRHVALAMKMNRFMCSYDKDPVTGKVTFHGDLSGEYVLSDGNSNLCFNSSNALHCGFSSGTADTTAQLAKLLNMPRWNEVDDYGRRISEEWQRTCEKAKAEIPLLISRYNYKNVSSGDAVTVLGTRIGIIEDILRWWDRCPNVTQQMVPPKEILDRELAELRKQVADIRRRQGRR